MGIPTQAIASGKELLEYIPQREPIVMVDSFYGVQGNSSYSGLTIAADNILVNNGYFTESGLIEHMAQSAALQAGYVCKQNNIPVPVGFIGGIKNLVINLLPNVGDVLYTCVTNGQDVFGIKLITAQTRIGDQLVAECEMKIFLKSEE